MTASRRPIDPGVMMLLAAVAGALAAGARGPGAPAARVVRQDGPVESATVLLYVIAGCAVLFMPNRYLRSIDRAAVAYVLFACVAREISLGKLLVNADLAGYCCTPQQTRLVLGLLLAVL